MIDQLNLEALVKEIAYLNGFDQGPLCDGQRVIMRKSILPEINLGSGYYAQLDLNWCRRLSKAGSLLTDIKDSGIQICVFYTMKIF